MTTTASQKPVDQTADFYIRTKSLEVKHDGDGDEAILIATASSTAVDLEADRFTKTALEQMRDGFPGRLIFMNHSYKVPQDVFGTVRDAKLLKRDGRLDLDLEIVVEQNNPLAMQTYNMVAAGTRLGVSVGVIVTDVEKTDEEDDWGHKIIDIVGVIPLEASIVGIPANQTAWTQEAIKSLFARGAIDLDADEVTARPWLIDPIGDDDVVEDKGAIASHAPAKAPQGRAWQASSAVKRLRSWAGGPAKEDMQWGKYRRGFTWFDAGDSESFGAYKLPHHDIINSTFMVVFRGAAAAAVVLQGGRGGVNIPEGDVGKVKAHIARHYHQFDEQAPWEREKSEGWIEIELAVAEDLQVELPSFEEATWPEEDDPMDKPIDAHARPPDVPADEPPADEPAGDEPPADEPAGDEPPADEPAGDEPPADEPAGDEPPADEPKADDAPPADTKDDFEDEVDADLAVDDLLDKMYSGFRALLNNLIPIMLNTELDVEQRREEGAEIVKSYQEFTEATWNETMDGLAEKDFAANDAAAGWGDEEFTEWMHDTVAVEAGCKNDDIGSMLALWENINDQRQSQLDGLQEEKKALEQRIEALEGALDYAEGALSEIMDMPLGSVTQEADKVARSLAERFPTLDHRVVKRIEKNSARRAPTTESEE